jgi:LL-diaminopimelate aminotransferase
VAYPIQKAAEAVYTKEGRAQCENNMAYYKNNARFLYDHLKKMGYETFGGRNAPYVWFKTPQGCSSWDFFDQLLTKTQVVGTPGSGFGSCGEGFMRFSAFGSKEDTREAMERINKL